jgi:hypothetical protein
MKFGSQKIILIPRLVLRAKISSEKLCYSKLTSTKYIGLLMKIENINIDEVIEKTRKSLVGLDNPALSVSIELLILIITLLVDRLGINSKNSSTPPSQDPFREKENKAKSSRKSGGQKGRKGSYLALVEDPDEKLFPSCLILKNILKMNIPSYLMKRDKCGILIYGEWSKNIRLKFA